MAAYALSLIHCDGPEDLLDKVQAIQADALSLIEGGFAVGSTTSESSCDAVRLCCNTLVEALTPIKNSLRQQTGSVEWETLISQIEGAFVQGIGFFMLEEYLTNPNGLVIADSTWSYKIPTVDAMPKQLNVEIMNSDHHQKCVLSSEASGEPLLRLAASVRCATRAAIKEARRQLASWGGGSSGAHDSQFQLSIPATMLIVKELIGLDIVQRFLKSSLADQSY